PIKPGRCGQKNEFFLRTLRRCFMKTTYLLLSSVLAIASGCDAADTVNTVSPGRAISLSSTTSSDQAPSELIVVNESHYDFRELAIARVSDPVWSENFLGSDPLYRHEQFAIENLPCDSFDLLIVDDTDRSCVLKDFWLCNGDSVTTWVTDNE